MDPCPENSEHLSSRHRRFWARRSGWPAERNACRGFLCPGQALDRLGRHFAGVEPVASGLKRRLRPRTWWPGLRW
jgi:hypothetical protein